MAIATGTGFPAGATIVLAWEPGIGATTVTVGPDGSFRVPVLILPRDLTGPRLLVWRDETSVGAAFTVVPGPMRPAGPPRFVRYGR